MATPEPSAEQGIYLSDTASTSSRSPSPISPTPSPPPQSNFSVLTEGRVFTLFSFSPTLTLHPSSLPPSSPLHSHPIFLFYVPSSIPTRLGTLHWCPPGQRSTSDPSLSLPVSLVSDIYLDQQFGSEWKERPLSDDSDDGGLCFTLVSKRYDVRLCLRAESSTVRSAFLTGVKELFHSARKPVLSERKKRMSAVDTLQSLLVRSPAISFMQQGQHLRRLLAHSFVAVPSFVHYIASAGGPLGGLVWNDDSRAVEGGVLTEVVNVLPLHTVSDVWGGKGYEGMAATEWEDAHCVTVVGKEGQVLHLVCDSEDKRRVWLDGIREVFEAVRKVGKTKETPDERQRRLDDEARKEAEAAAARDEAAAAVRGDHVAEGTEREMVLHTDDSTLTTDVTSLVAATPPPAATEMSEVSLSAAEMDVSDVHADGGFTYEVDESVARAEGRDDAAQDRAYSNAVADGVDPPLSTAESVADALAAGESYRYVSAEDNSAENSRNITYDAPEKASTAALPSTDTSSSTLSGRAHPAIQALVTGFSFISYTTTTATALHLHYSPDEGKLGTLYYSSPPSSPALPLPVSTLCDVFVGKQSPELRSAMALAADSARCVTIASRETALHLCAESEEEKALFLEGVKQIFLCQGKQVRGKKVKREKKAVAATQPISERMLREIRNHQQEVAVQSVDVRLSGDVAPLAQPDTAKQVNAAAEEKPTEPAVAAAEAAPSASAVATLSVPRAPESMTSTITDSMVVTVSMPRSPLQYLLTNHPLLSTLRDGATFTALFGAPPIPTLLLSLFVFYSPTSSKLGSIHWCDPAAPYTLVEGQSLPLHRFSDVIQGKVTAEMRSTAAAPLAAALCFSLVTKSRVLNLVARTEKERRDWVEGVRTVFTLAKGKLVDDAPRTAKPRVADLNRLRADPLPLDLAVQMLSSGYLVLFVWEDGA